MESSPHPRSIILSIPRSSFSPARGPPACQSFGSTQPVPRQDGAPRAGEAADVRARTHFAPRWDEIDARVAVVQPIMTAQGTGVVINIVSKAGVINRSLVMVQELALEIRVNVIALGGIGTPRRPMGAGAQQQASATSSRSALKRLATPEGHAGTIVWLASDYAGYMTGAVIDAHVGAVR